MAPDSVRELLRYFERIIPGLLIRDSWKSLNSCDVLLLKHNYQTSLLIGDKWFSPIIDSLDSIFRRRGLHTKSIALSPSKLSRNQFYFDTVTLNQSYAYNQLLGRMSKIFREEKISDDYSQNPVVIFWRKIILMSKPKVIIGIRPDSFLCRAARQLNVPIYDMQHGIISDNHKEYGKKFREVTPIEDLPNGFLCWDDSSVSTLKKWTVDRGIDVIKIGHPWFILSTEKFEDVELVELFNKSINLKVRPTILVTLQWGNYYDFSNNHIKRFIHPSLEKTILYSISNYNWMIRLHPVQLMGPERKHVIKYLRHTFGNELCKNWLNQSSLPLPLVLSITDLHISINSTVAIEASWRGIKTAFIGGKIPDGYFKKEFEEDYAEIIEGDEKIISDWIVNNIDRKMLSAQFVSDDRLIQKFIKNYILDTKKSNLLEGVDFNQTFLK